MSGNGKTVHRLLTGSVLSFAPMAANRRNRCKAVNFAAVAVAIALQRGDWNGCSAEKAMACAAIEGGDPG